MTAYLSEHTTELLGYKIFSKKASQWAKRKKYSQKFYIFFKNNYNSAKNINFLARSNLL